MAMTALMTASCGGGKSAEDAKDNNIGFNVGGRNVVLSAICDSAKTAGHIARYPDRWNAVAAFLASSDLAAMKEGEYEILPEKEVYAIVSAYEPKETDSCRFEAHRRYIDLQYLISGEERMGIVPLGDAGTVLVPYVDDIEFYSPDSIASAEYAEANPDTVFVFFPDDVHRPSMRVSDKADSVKKIVVKIKY